MIVYDVESYPNFFSVVFREKGDRHIFEISPWYHGGNELFEYLCAAVSNGAEFVGFNNLNYDSRILHFIYRNSGKVTAEEINELSKAIIEDRVPPMKWRDVILRQVDLFKIHHFDNKARRTGLKTLEINMGSDNVIDLPYDPTKPLTYEQSREVIKYNIHDVDETVKFLRYSIDKVKMRRRLSERYGKSFMNFSDKRVGTEIMVKALNDRGIRTRDDDWNPIQTIRCSINIAEVILGYINFETPEFRSILDFFKSQEIVETKGAFKDLSVILEGIEYSFGTGGIHASVHNTIVEATDEWMMLDIDVASFYPNLAIANNFYPEHLGPSFCEAYLSVYLERKKFEKGTPENEAYKLALNGVYGDSNNEYSEFYDPKYTMSITINGQLLLAMLVEQMLKVPGLRVIQANTDGITIYYKRMYYDHVLNVVKWWEELTSLTLEPVEYSRMFIRDVNSYIAETVEGKLKRIGAYAYVRQSENPGTREITWNKDHSMLIVPKAAEAALVRDESITSTILGCSDPIDMCLSTKVPRRFNLVMRSDNGDIEVQRNFRYYVSKEGFELVKIMPPTQSQIDKWEHGDHYYHKKNGKHVVVLPGRKPPSGMYELGDAPSDLPPNRETKINSGHLISDCCDISNFNWRNVDYRFYINEAMKLVSPLINGALIRGG